MPYLGWCYMYQINMTIKLTVFFFPVGMLMGSSRMGSGKLVMSVCLSVSLITSSFSLAATLHENMRQDDFPPEITYLYFQCRD